MSTIQENAAMLNIEISQEIPLEEQNIVDVTQTDL